MMAQKEVLVLLASPEIQVPLENLVLLDWMVWQETREMTEKQVNLAPLVHQVKLVGQGLQAKGGPQGLQGNRESKEKRDQRVNLVLRDTLEK